MSLTQRWRASIIADAYRTTMVGGERVLDIGCGNGVVGTYLSESLGVQITGTDISNYLSCDIPWVSMTGMEELPFPSGAFDVAMLNDVLHHCANPEGVIAEAGRVAGTVLIFEDCRTLLLKFVDVWVNRLYHTAMPCPLSFQTRNEWLSTFNRLGFAVSELPVKRPKLYPFDHMAFRLSK